MRLVNLSCTIKKDPQKILQLSGKKTVDIWKARIVTWDL
jgi:hypothetical protein